MNSIPNHMPARPAADWIGRATCVVVRPKTGVGVSGKASPANLAP